jgi:hypothetical protein
MLLECWSEVERYFGLRINILLWASGDSGIGHALNQRLSRRGRGCSTCPSAEIVQRLQWVRMRRYRVSH